MQILIIDLGSQYTLVLSRSIRELGIYPTVLPPEEVQQWLITNPKPKGIILTGGDKSVYDDDAPQVPLMILDQDVPILGVCYGMHWMAKFFGGEVISNKAPKYGHKRVMFGHSALLNRAGSDEVWASHGDIVTRVPANFTIDATYMDETVAAMSNKDERLFGLQFHPEVMHTLSGRDILKNFVFEICHCVEDWRPSDIVSTVQKQVREIVGNNKAVLAFSGGVDSTTLARTINFLGDNLLAVLIDTGGLREGEVEQAKLTAERVGVNLKVVDASELFISMLNGNFQSESKRIIFKRWYRVTLENEAKQFGGDDCIVIQGTIAPDVIESGAVGKASLIKSHHNVNQEWNFINLAPFSNLFKFEVRTLARHFGLGDIAEQMPFPGPGLFIRVIGPITRERLEVVRWATAQATQILKVGGVYEQISQLVVAMIGVDVVGIKGDHRAYGPALVVRCAQTEDYMTAKGYQIDRDLRERITSILCEHPYVCRVWYDETNKPPGTIEFE